MKPLHKWLLGGIATLLVLGALVVVAVSTLVDPDRLRPAVAEAVRASTGRTLTLAGDVGLKLFPCCAIELKDASLGNPPGFVGEPFLRVASARLSLRLWPLLSRRQVSVGTVEIAGVAANLVGRKDGSNNWTFSEGPTGPSGTAPADVRGSDIGGFDLGGIRLEDARIDYRDEADGARYRVDQLQLTTGPVRSGEPFDLRASLRVTDLVDDSGGTVRLAGQTRVSVAGEVTTVELADLKIEPDLKGVAGLDALSGTLEAPSLVVRLAADTTLQAPAATAELQLAGADLPDGPVPFKAALQDLSYSLDAESGSLGGLQAAVTLAGVPLELDGKGRFGARNDLGGSLRFPAISLREVLPRLGTEVPKTADPKALTRFDGSANWVLGEKSLGLDRLALQLDDTKVSGTLSRELLPAGSGRAPRTRFDLTLDALDADRYLAPAGGGGPAGKGGGGSAGQDAPTEIPAKALRGLNLEGRARVGRLTVNNLRMADLDVRVDAGGGRVRLAPLAARLYGGALKCSLGLDATGEKTRMTVDQSFTGVNLGALLADLADVSNVSGTATVKIDGVAVGRTDDELLDHLGGNLAFSLANGTYQGMDVWYEIRRARALIRRKPPPGRTGPEETPIKSLQLDGRLSNGELRTSRFTAEIPFLRVSGDATVNLPRGTLDSRLTALVHEKPVFGDDTSLQDLMGVQIPLTVRGPVASPKVGVDLGKMVRGTLKKTVEDKIREKLGIGAAGEEGAPAEGQQAPSSPQEDAVKKALDRLFR